MKNFISIIFDRKNLYNLIFPFLIMSLFIDANIISNKKTETEHKVSVGKTNELNSLPLQFEENIGQALSEIKYISRGPGFTLFLKSTDLSIKLRNKNLSQLVRLKMLNANRNSKMNPMNKLIAKTNYISAGIQNNSKKEISNYSKIVANNIYDGISVVYYGNSNKEFEYDFIVKPKAEYKNILVECSGMEKIELADDGSLSLIIEDTSLKLKKPIAYQIIGNKREELLCEYKVYPNNVFGFSVGDYNPEIELIIDPILSYSTYLGGNGEDIGNDIAIDKDGYAYITGRTTSSNFPTNDSAIDTSGKKGGFFDKGDVFITKLDSSGSSIIYSTYISGNGLDIGFGIAVDSNGCAIIVGATDSEDDPNTSNIDEGIPLKNAFQANYGGNGDLFVLKLNETGSSIIYSSYLGGSENDRGDTEQDKPSIAVDRLGNAYVGGTTQSTDFPTTAGAFMNNGSAPYVVKILPDGSIGYSTTLGGDPFVFAQDIAVDKMGQAYLTGFTGNPNLPTTQNSYQPVKNDAEDIFLYKLNSTGTGLVYCTYLGGNSDDFSYGMTVDVEENVFITGNSFSTDYPISFGQAVVNNCVVTKLNPSGTSILFSLVTSGFVGKDIANLDNGLLCVTSEDSDGTGTRDIVLTVIDTLIPQINFETYLGGLQNDIPNALGVDNKGNVFITGVTGSEFFPGEEPINTNPYQSSLKTTPDGFVIKYSIYDVISSVPENEIPKSLSILNQNYPNPFNPTTTIEFVISQNSSVTLKIYDVLGHELETLVDEQKSSGKYSVKFKGDNYSSGIYFFKLKAGKFSETKRMLLMK